MSSSRYRAGGTTLYLRNLSERVRYEDIKRLFQKYGRLVDVTIPLDYYSRQPKGYCFIEFEDPRDAEEAQYHMDRRRLFDREIEVEFARGDRKTPGEMRTRDPRDYRRGGDRRRGGGGGMDYDRRSRSRSRDRYARGGGYERRERSGDRYDHRAERGGGRERSPLDRPRRDRSGDRAPVERSSAGVDRIGANGSSPYSRSKSRSYSKNRTPSPRAAVDAGGKSRSRSRSRVSVSPRRGGGSPKVADSSMNSRSRSASPS